MEEMTIGMKMLRGCSPGASDEVIDFTEKNLRMKFPKEFIECIKQTDRGVPERSIFEFVDPITNEIDKGAIGAFLSFDPSYKSNILRKYFTRPSFFPHGLLAFAEMGNGDMICFDYTIGGFEDRDPPIVFWIHDYPEGQEVVDIAITFRDFLEKLKPVEDEE